MLPTRCLLVLCAACAASCPAYAAWTWQRMEYPGATSTDVSGIWGDKLVGTYGSSWGGGAFLYDGTTWSTLSFPGAAATSAWGVWQDKVVGSYSMGGLFDTGFVFDGTTWTSLRYPGALETKALAIDGNRIVGYYTDSLWRDHGFLYDGQNWRRLDYPGTYSDGGTWARGISGNNIVGSYITAGGGGPARGFIYDDNAWTCVNPESVESSILMGISGNVMLGNAQGHRSFFYDGTTFTWLDLGWYSMAAYGISGNRIVGTCVETPGAQRYSFVLTIPEPASLALLALGLASVLRRRAAPVQGRVCL